MAKFDDKINSLLNEFTTGMAGMMKMSSDNLQAAPGWRYVHDEEEETGKYDDGDGKKERCDFVPCKGKKSKDEDAEDKTGKLSDKKLLKKDEKRGTMGKGTIKQAKKEIKKSGDVTPKMRDRMAADAYAKKK